jgi:iron(III) transport system permease protein
MLMGIAGYLWSIRSGARFVSMSGKGARASRVRLGAPLRVVSLFAILAFFFAAVLLPYGVLVLGSFSSYFATLYFDPSLLTLRHYQAFLARPDAIAAMKNTAVLMLVGATITTFLAVLVARSTVRMRFWWRHVLDSLAVAPVFMPGAVLGLGLFWAYVFIPTGLYGTTALLLIAFITRFVGHGTRVLSPALLQVSSEFEEAAYTLGSSRLGAFFRITVPLLRTPLASAWVLIAIFIAMELASSIFLYTSASITGSVLVYRTMSGGEVSPAFTAGTVLATLTFIIVGIAQWRLRALDKL